MRRPDTQASLTVYDGDESACTKDISDQRDGFEDPLDTTLEWSWEEQMRVPIPVDA